MGSAVRGDRREWEEGREMEQELVCKIKIIAFKRLNKIKLHRKYLYCCGNFIIQQSFQCYPVLGVVLGTVSADEKLVQPSFSVGFILQFPVNTKDCGSLSLLWIYPQINKSFFIIHYWLLWNSLICLHFTPIEAYLLNDTHISI